MKYHSYNKLKKHIGEAVLFQKLCKCCLGIATLVHDDRKKKVWLDNYGGLVDGTTIPILFMSDFDLDQYFTQERYLDWGKDGQMQIETIGDHHFCITTCHGPNYPDDELSLWKEYTFEENEEFLFAIAKLEKENFYAVN